MRKLLGRHPKLTTKKENEMKVYKAINSVQTELSKIGITKSRTNTQGAGYKFRGIDDIFNTISPLLAEHKLCILPRVIARDCVERISQRGLALFYVTVEVEFDFVSSEDVSKHIIKTFGEAMDSGDKATNKAMSAAYKYAALQAFAIPTEGDNDSETQTHEIQPEPTRQPTAEKIPENQIIDFISAIESSSNEEEIKKYYTAAYRLAQGKKDQDAIKRFTEAKDQAKSKLENQ